MNIAKIPYLKVVTAWRRTHECEDTSGDHYGQRLMVKCYTCGTPLCSICKNTLSAMKITCTSCPSVQFHASDYITVKHTITTGTDNWLAVEFTSMGSAKENDEGSAT